MEPDADRHHIFGTFQAAQDAWEVFQADESIDPEVRAAIAAPRQALVNCWIFDRGH